jgi:hypothetical protein
MICKAFKTTLWREGNLCAIRVPFDPREVLGKTRAPVIVTLNGYTYRSTIAVMGGQPLIPLRKSHRDAAGLEGNETLQVRLELDTGKREITPPADLLNALKAAPGAWRQWQALSYTRRREHVEAVEKAKKPETRARRVERAVAALQSPGSKPSN